MLFILGALIGMAGALLLEFLKQNPDSGMPRGIVAIPIVMMTVGFVMMFYWIFWG